ncbi:DUF2304 domain-containing protein [Cellulomonas denverensis]|uniref:DUF2304 domain-containing protein n=1 Tax=Cellulomonas denverensis TaxID=264297 RepID=A0A7X6QYV4_9CELL|nr:DUF2304 domain-containing protein [Cellulomonas denverensis]NKY22523.1 DUF2304 domain-containing protein [Cellulomonas denverensis]GIG24833.1 hypothetical protein Cde04nite_10770 [Cellulomonas denverensis]
MMTGYWFALGACLLLLVFLVVLMRTRRIREKYALIWVALTAGVCIVGAFPSAVAWLARLVGVQTPSNLLFAFALVLLLLVCIQLSVEMTTMEEEARTLTEEVALLRFDLERLAAGSPRQGRGSHPPVTGPTPVVPAQAQDGTE